MEMFGRHQHDRLVQKADVKSDAHHANNIVAGDIRRRLLEAPESDGKSNNQNALPIYGLNTNLKLGGNLSNSGAENQCDDGR